MPLTSGLPRQADIFTVYWHVSKVPNPEVEAGLALRPQFGLPTRYQFPELSLTPSALPVGVASNADEALGERPFDQSDW